MFYIDFSRCLNSWGTGTELVAGTNESTEASNRQEGDSMRRSSREDRGGRVGLIARCCWSFVPLVGILCASGCGEQSGTGDENFNRKFDAPPGVEVKALTNEQLKEAVKSKIGGGRREN